MEVVVEEAALVYLVLGGFEIVDAVAAEEALYEFADVFVGIGKCKGANAMSLVLKVFTLIFVSIDIFLFAFAFHEPIFVNSIIHISSKTIEYAFSVCFTVFPFAYILSAIRPAISAVSANLSIFEIALVTIG